MQQLFDWAQAHPQYTTLALLFSILVLLGFILLSPYLAASIPEDYFSNPNKRTLHPRSTLFGALRRLARNFLGLILLSMGLVMLVTPGQGILTIFVALMALDYPGKYRLERWLFARSSIQRSINWLRKRAGAPPLTEPQNPAPEAASQSAQSHDGSDSR